MSIWIVKWLKRNTINRFEIKYFNTCENFTFKQIIMRYILFPMNYQCGIYLFYCNICINTQKITWLVILFIHQLI